MTRTATIHTANGPALAPGTWHNAMCSDGTVRSAQILREPDTFSTVPARVQVCRGQYRHTVTGFVYWADAWTEAPVLKFSANAWLPNARYLPPR